MLEKSSNSSAAHRGILAQKGVADSKRDIGCRQKKLAKRKQPELFRGRKKEGVLRTAQALRAFAHSIIFFHCSALFSPTL